MSVRARFLVTLKRICLIVAVGVLTHGMAPTVASGQTTDAKKTNTPTKASRPEIILIDGVQKRTIYDKGRAEEPGQRGTNVDDLYDKLYNKPYMLNSEVRHQRWKRIDYIKARAPKVIIVGIQAFAQKDTDPPLYASSQLVDDLLLPLATTNIKFLVYYQGDLARENDEKKEIEQSLCSALDSTKKKGVCERRLGVVNAGRDSFPSEAFIDRLSKELARLAQ